MKNKVLALIVFVVSLSSCATSNHSTCATYSSSKPLSVKVGTYNPRKPAGMQVGRTVVGRIQ